MSIDTMSDFLTSIRNAILVRKRFVICPYSSFKQSVAQVLQDEGFIRGYEVLDDSAESKKSIKLLLKYVNGASVISEIKRVSTQGRRVYSGSADFKRVIGGLGINIVSTSKGVMSDSKAKKFRSSEYPSGLGGEVLCSVW